MAGAPATTNTSSNVTRKKVNPARARRSKLRFEEFMKKKSTESTLGDRAKTRINFCIFRVSLRVTK